MSEAQNNDMNQPLLNLSPQEKAAYSHLFKLADVDSLGVLTGERAVTFFEKTRVPAQVLGEIWQIADTENRGLLTKPGFCMVMRLIGCYQAGESPRTDLAFKPGPLPKFDGIAIPNVDAPGAPKSPVAGQFPLGALQPQLSGQSTGGGPIRIPPLDPAKVQQYSSLFEKSGAQNGILDGGTAKNIFERSGLPNDVLGKIWMLSDREQRGALDQTEFIVAMHLLTSMKTRAMTSLPTVLPAGLYEAAARRGQRPPSRQMTGPPVAPVSRQFTGGPPPRTQSPLARSTQSPQSTNVAGPHWLVTAQEKSQYDRFFSTIDTSGSGIISGEQAVRFFSDSRLPEDTLASIWDLADINSEGQLNRDEFAVAMYLIRQQRQPNGPPLPAFLPPALIPPSLRGQQQQVQHSTAPSFDNPAAAPPSNIPKSAAEDLFGLDEPSQPQPPAFQPQLTGTSATRDPFSGSQPSSPSSPQRFQPQSTGGASTTFKPFIPTSAFGASIASQNTGGSVSSGQGARGFAQAQSPTAQPMSGAMDDLLGDNETHAEESSKITNETTELANMSNQIGNLRTQMEQTQSRKASTQADLTATSNQKRDLEARLQQFRTQYESEVRAVKELEQQLSASKESTKKLTQELAMLEGTYQDLQTQHNQVSQALQADQQENATLKQRINQINAEVAKLKPDIEKLKMDARQQKGLVSINKKQLATNESERDRLQSEKSTLESEAAEQARSAAASPEPAGYSRDVVSPAASTMSSTNPFFRKPNEPAVATPPAATSPAPTPSAFDALFGPSSAFAPTGQTNSRSGTPPATSFIGRSLPASSTVGTTVGGVVAGGLAAVGLTSMADSVSSAGEVTPSATPPPSAPSTDMQTPTQEAPPPSVGTQFTPSNLPINALSTGEGSDTASSLNVIPPASRAGELATPIPTPDFGAVDREIVPGAFPDEDAHAHTPTQVLTPPTTQAEKSSTHDEFDSAFASFGEGQTSEIANGGEDPFAQHVASQKLPTSGFNSEFPPIENLELDDDSDSESEPEHTGFDDNFAGQSQGNSVEVPSESLSGVTETPAEHSYVASASSAAGNLPDISQQVSPPTYEQSNEATQGSTSGQAGSNNFPPEFDGLLPAREDPTSPPPPAEFHSSESAFAPPVQSGATTTTSRETGFAEPQTIAVTQSPALATSDVFHDASSQPIGQAQGVISTSAKPADEPKNAFDEFDDFNDLSEAKEADKNASDGFEFGRESVDEFNPAFDSPAASMMNTPMARSMQQSQDSTNGFANFTPNATSTSAFGSGIQNGSIQNTPQNVQHDWDAIFSGLDSGDKPDTTLSHSDDPWGSAPISTTNGGTTTSTSAFAPPQMSTLGRAVTPGTEHDDPILKRLTGMGYARAEALNALEMHDYDINRAVDHLTGG